MSSLKLGNPAIALTTSYDAPATAGGLAAATPSANHPSSGKNRKLQAKLSSLPGALKLNLRRGSHRTGAPTESESELLGLLCVRVIAARNLASKDRNGKSDPFLVFRVGEARAESECIKASLNPVWGKHEGVGLHLDQVDGSSDKEAFCVAPIWAETLSDTRIEVVAWDKDSFRRSEYLGEISLGIEDWLDTSGAEVPVLYHDPKNTAVWTSISTSRTKSKVSGELLVKVGWLGYPTTIPELQKQNSTEKKNDLPSSNGNANSQSAVNAAVTQINASSIRQYAHSNPLSHEQEAHIRSTLNEAILNRKLSMFGMLDRKAGADKSIASVRINRASMAPEMVFNAPASEGVGTLRIGDKTRGALSNELTNAGSDSDSDDFSFASAEEDEEEMLDNIRDDELSASSEASSMLEDIDEYSEGDVEANDYFDTALGMSDAPKAAPPAAASSEDSLKPQLLVATSQPTTPGATTPGGSRRKLPIPGFFKRTNSSKSSVNTTLQSGTGNQRSHLDITSTIDDSSDTAAAPEPAYRRKKFTRRKVKLGVDDSSEVGGVDVSGKDKKKKRHKRKKSRTGKRRRSSEDSPVQGPGGYSLSTGATSQDFLGVVFIEVKGATGLPRWRNMTRLGWDMDPFCIVSFGKKVFRTRVIRHSRSPVWDEKLFFHIKRHEHAYQILFSLFDWDKMSSNDFVGEVTMLLNELTAKAPKPDEISGVFPVDQDGKIIGDQLHDFNLPLASKSADLEEDAKDQPQLQIRAKFTPYSALRQRFWRTYLAQYDTDDSQHWSYVELYSLLDSLGSTLTRATIESFFTRFDKSPEDSLTVDEAIICLEDELTKPTSEKRQVDSMNPYYSKSAQSGLATPSPESSLTLGDNVAGNGMSYTGPPITGEPENGVEPKDTPASGRSSLGPNDALTARSSSTSLSSGARKPPSRQSSLALSDTAETAFGEDNSHELEKLINIKTCPLCHKKLTKKAEVDLVSHLAVCASQDWSSLSSLTVANFVSTSQAHRKWFTKLVNKVSNGSYKLGADSANILVQNRMTGQLEEEKMQVYVRVGIRLWYRAAGSSSRMEANRIKKLLRSMSVKQGIKFNAPESTAEIPRFIAFHGLNMNEVRDPIESFEHFNAFFYRKLKPDARPAENPHDPGTLVSSADCRMTCFPTISEATSLWIKGRTFSIKRLLGKELEHEASRYNGGALAIFRLAPQDYHRYHSPVDGKIGKMSRIPGEYYTVNPIAIRSSLDVYAENARVIVPMDSPTFGKVMNVCIGAMMVGTICFTKEEGDDIKRAEEYGYFAFGGSTIVLLFEPNTVEFDEDLVANSRACIETLVRVGMRIGKRV